MVVMTAKVDMKKILLIAAAAAAAILALILMLGGRSAESAPTSAPAASGNDARVKFLQDFGWEVASSPVQSGQVRIPDENSEVYARYNALQLSQGYDLRDYSGKKVMRYVYKIGNYPGAAEPVYATLLVYKGKIIGGDVTDTAAKGQIHGFRMPAGAARPVPTGTLPSVTESAPDAESGTLQPQESAGTKQ